ncbi:hypothetical protein G3I60_04780 [Streptomyces sp. SID13666]|uniref:hypothetical protein n=1 Tax=Streptomyces sp. SID13666 TaxID=2706054 RepID=UPI0013C284E6|nr:hypothetical protein [Streptomyces sp. SID13666]NEA53486.1 hypothetical protein [Streptomyces sp. SID13666]
MLLAAAVPALVGGTSHAAVTPAAVVAAPSAGLPPIDTEIESTMTVVDCPITLDVGVVKLNFEGTIKQVVASDPNEADATKAVRLRTTGFHMEATTPDGKIKVVLDMKDPNNAPDGLLSVVTSDPPQFAELDILDLAATIELSGEFGTTTHVLTSANPMRLLNPDLHRFPAVDALYQLQEAVSLIDANGTKVASIDDFLDVRNGPVHLPESP